jgi:hypothetical protein
MQASMLARTLRPEKLSMHQNCCNSCKNILHVQKKLSMANDEHKENEITSHS